MPLQQPQVHAAGEGEMQRAVAIETGRAAELQIGVGAVQVRLLDADFVAAIGQLKVLIVGELHEFVVERDPRDVGVHFDRIGLAQARRKL